MIINYRTYTSLAATGLFEWLVSKGIITLSNPYINAETLESVIITGGLVLAGVFRKYAGEPLFKKNPTQPKK